MYLGSCECKSVKYKFNGKPLTCYACHCTDCQTSSGSAFGLSMIVNDKDIEIIKGEVAINIIDVKGTKVHRHHYGSLKASRKKRATLLTPGYLRRYVFHRTVLI